MRATRHSPTARWLDDCDKDRSLSAQWEHTVLVTDTGFEVMTLSSGKPGRRRPRPQGRGNVPLFADLRERLKSRRARWLKLSSKDLPFRFT